MGKRSDFTRRPHDRYFTPMKAVEPIASFLRDVKTFVEPCCGDGRLIHHVEAYGPRCVWRSDIDPRHDLFAPCVDALELELPTVDAIITNPPWTRALLHPMILRFMTHAPTWLLFDADWSHNRQAAPFLPQCSHIVSVGRVKWFDDSSGKDNAAWYRFDSGHQGGPHFYGR